MTLAFIPLLIASTLLNSTLNNVENKTPCSNFKFKHQRIHVSDDCLGEKIKYVDTVVAIKDWKDLEFLTNKFINKRNQDVIDLKCDERKAPFTMTGDCVAPKVYITYVNKTDASSLFEIKHVESFMERHHGLKLTAKKFIDNTTLIVKISQILPSEKHYSGKYLVKMSNKAISKVEQLENDESKKFQDISWWWVKKSINGNLSSFVDPLTVGPMNVKISNVNKMNVMGDLELNGDFPRVKFQMSLLSFCSCGKTFFKQLNTHHFKSNTGHLKQLNDKEIEYSRSKKVPIDYIHVTGVDYDLLGIEGSDCGNLSIMINLKIEAYDVIYVNQEGICDTISTVFVKNGHVVGGDKNTIEMKNHCGTTLTWMIESSKGEPKVVFEPKPIQRVVESEKTKGISKTIITQLIPNDYSGTMYIIKKDCDICIRPPIDIKDSINSATLTLKYDSYGNDYFFSIWQADSDNSVTLEHSMAPGIGGLGDLTITGDLGDNPELYMNFRTYLKGKGNDFIDEETGDECQDSYETFSYWYPLLFLSSSTGTLEESNRRLIKNTTYSGMRINYFRDDDVTVDELLYKLTTTDMELQDSIWKYCVEPNTAVSFFINFYINNY